jgi:hypothetical protein
MEALNLDLIIRMINQKFVENYENKDKAEVLTEILNDVKLYLLPTENTELH